MDLQFRHQVLIVRIKEESSTLASLELDYPTLLVTDDSSIMHLYVISLYINSKTFEEPGPAVCGIESKGKSRQVTNFNDLSSFHGARVFVVVLWLGYQNTYIKKSPFRRDFSSKIFLTSTLSG
jgi:hypothetical protein